MTIRTFLLFLVYLGCHAILYGQNQPPVIANLSATIDNDAVRIHFDVTDPENDPLEIRVRVSDDGGQTFLLAPLVLSGDTGYPVMPGTGKSIVWHSGQLMNPAQIRIKVIATDRQPVDIQTLVDQVDSNRLYDYLSFIEGVRHRQTGASHLRAVQDSLMRWLSGYGLPVDTFRFNFSGYQALNITGRIAGTADEKITFICDGHYDTVNNSPGADDNGSAVAGVLEAARILSQYQFRHSIRFIFFDLEEAGLIGSYDYVLNGRIQPWEDIRGVFNFEMIGFYSNKPNSQTLPAGFDILFPTQAAEVAADNYRGNFLTNVANTTSTNLMEAFDSLAEVYVPQLKVISLAVPGNGTIAPDLRRSDHAPFWDAGIPALMLTDGANFRNPNYHTPEDTIESLNFTFMSRTVKATVAALAALAGVENSDQKTTGLAPQTVLPGGIPLLCQPEVTCIDGKINIQMRQCPAQRASIQVINASGQRVYAGYMAPAGENGSFTLNLPAGIYCLNIFDGKSIFSTKFSVVR